MITLGNQSHDILFVMSQIYLDIIFMIVNLLSNRCKLGAITEVVLLYREEILTFFLFLESFFVTLWKINGYPPSLHYDGRCHVIKH